MNTPQVGGQPEQHERPGARRPGAGAASGVASHRLVGLVPLEHAHDRVRRLPHRGLHRVRGDQAGHDEGEVGRGALELVGVALDEAAEQHAHRHDVEERREERLRRPTPRQVRLVDRRPVVELARITRSARLELPTGCDVGGRPSVHQRPAGEPEEDVLERGPADQHGDRLEAALVHLGDHLLAVVGCRRAAGRAAPRPGRRGRRSSPRPRRARPDPEPELGDLARGVVADQVERGALGDDQRPCPSPRAGRTAARPRPCSGW